MAESSMMSGEEGSEFALPVSSSEPVVCNSRRVRTSDAVSAVSPLGLRKDTCRRRWTSSQRISSGSQPRKWTRMWPG